MDNDLFFFVLVIPYPSIHAPLSSPFLHIVLIKVPSMGKHSVTKYEVINARSHGMDNLAENFVKSICSKTCFRSKIKNGIWIDRYDCQMKEKMLFTDEKKTLVHPAY